MSRRIPVNTAVVVVAATATAVVLADAGGYELRGRLIVPPRSTGGGFALVGTVTPGTAPTMSGGSYAITGGARAAAGTTTSSQAAPRATAPDHNADGTVDARDLVLVLTERNEIDDGTIDRVIEVIDAMGAKPAHRAGR